MRFAGIALGFVAFGGVVLVAGPGCRDATQVTVEISLAPRASCAETHGTAITVGVDPSDTEKRVTQQYVTASTDSCDAASKSIGTLVVTPSDPGSASVVVVVAYDANVAPSSCTPPLYKGCIVARRHFGFSAHQQLHLPITIDPDCKDVPCDAFSTCRTGQCFKSDIACAGDGCTEPGATPDGGTSEAGVVIPDAGVTDGGVPGLDGSIDGSIIDAGSDAGGNDASSDAGDSGATASTHCNVPIGPSSLVCGNMSCGGATNYCCGTSADVATCSLAPCTAGKSRFCCVSADCGGNGCLTSVVANSPMPVGGDIGVCSAVVAVPPPNPVP